jgi:hypothetical protein
MKAESENRKPESDERGGFVFDERFAEAFFHVPGGHRVLGRRLRPFCAWHRVQLEYLDNAFVMDDVLPEPGDLRLAVAVCSLRFPEVVRPPSVGRGWWRRITQLHAGRKDARLRETAWFAREVMRFRLYVADYLSLPKMHVAQKKGKGGPGGESMRLPDMDETLLDVALYRHLTGCDRVEPWEIPIGELVWMTAAVARCKGLDLRVTTTADEERLERLKEKRKAESEKAESTEKE